MNFFRNALAPLLGASIAEEGPFKPVTLHPDELLLEGPFIRPDGQREWVSVSVDALDALLADALPASAKARLSVQAYDALLAKAQSLGYGVYLQRWRDDGLI